MIRACEIANGDPDVQAIEQEWDVPDDPVRGPEIGKMPPCVIVSSDVVNEWLNSGAGSGLRPYPSPGTPPMVFASFTARRIACATASAAAIPSVLISARRSPSERAKVVSPSSIVFTG